MSSNKNSYPIPDGYKEIEFQTEHHIDHIGKGFHKKDAEGNLVMAFYVKPENGNSGGVAHGGMLMSIAEYSLCSAAMESREKYVATISFRSEFISGAKIGSLLEVHTKISKHTKSLVFGGGMIISEGKKIMSFNGVVKKM